ncbi:ABC transporter transmembrane domain-containing protein, partial [Streptomyces fradiae]|uniref:ABC transporter transmembrane domain-containing protein n=1 Tax=Streptomyces fradiae TaxID=1906 RepID=UPI00365259F8
MTRPPPCSPPQAPRGDAPDGRGGTETTDHREGDMDARRAGGAYRDTGPGAGIRPGAGIHQDPDGAHQDPDGARPDLGGTRPDPGGVTAEGARPDAGSGPDAGPGPGAGIRPAEGVRADRVSDPDPQGRNGRDTGPRPGGRALRRAVADEGRGAGAGNGPAHGDPDGPRGDPDGPHGGRDSGAGPAGAEAEAPRGALRALLPVLGEDRAMRAMTVRTFLAGLVDQAALVALVTLAAYTVGTAVARGEVPGAGTVAALVGLVLVRAVATWREMDLSHDLAYRVLAGLRVRVFDGLARSAPARIGGRRSGDLAAAALGDVEALEFFYAHAVARLAASAAVFAGGSVVLAAADPALLAAVVPAAALLAVVPVLDARGRAARGARTRRAAADLSADAVETVDGMPELLAFGALDRRRARLRERGRRLGDAQRASASSSPSTVISVPPGRARPRKPSIRLDG